MAEYVVEVFMEAHDIFAHLATGSFDIDSDLESDDDPNAVR